MSHKEETKNLKEKTISGLFWRFGERITAQLISFVVSIVLARILLPEQYGTIACVTIFIDIANVFVTSGLGTSLVQKKNADKLDFSTMFWASFFMSFVLYAILFFTAPLIGQLYNDELLVIVIRVMGLKLPIAAISSIQQAYVANKMIFKKFFFSTLFGTLISAAVGIIMAIKGFGLWALLAQYLTNSLIDTIVLFITVDWRPKLMFSWERFKGLFGYGWKIMASSFIGALFNHLKSLVIGIKYTPADLAYNTKGEQFPNIITNNLNVAFDSVLFSSIAKIQDDKVAVKNVLRKSLKIGAFTLSPLLLGLAGAANSIIIILLSDSWIQCVPYLQIICFHHIFLIFNTINMQAIKAIGRSDIILKLEFIKKPLYILMIIAAIPFGPLAICLSNSLYGLVALIINTRYNKMLFDYTLKEQIADVFGYILMALVMAAAVYGIGILNLNLYLTLVIQIIVGVILYIGMAKLFKVDILETIKAEIKKYIRGKREVKNV